MTQSVKHKNKTPCVNQSSTASRSKEYEHRFFPLGFREAAVRAYSRLQPIACVHKKKHFTGRSMTVNVIQILNANRIEGYTTSAMDGAAWNGHLEVVQCLHANRNNKGCSKWALEGAAKKGHVEVLKMVCTRTTARETHENANTVGGSSSMSNPCQSLFTLYHSDKLGDEWVH